jgi:hypothetical protein
MPSTVTVFEQPEGSEVTIEGETVTLTHPGVYRIDVAEGMHHASAEVVCFPVHAFDHPQMVNTTKRPKTEPEKRMVLRSLAMHADLDGARKVLIEQCWWRAALVGGSADECMSLQPYGGN